MQDDSINDTARGPAEPFSGDDDTRERKKRETVTEAAEERYLKKRTRRRIEGRTGLLANIMPLFFTYCNRNRI